MKTNIIAKFIREDRPHETMLIVFENKNGLRGTLCNSYGKKIESRFFPCKDVHSVEAMCKVKMAFDFYAYNSYAILS